jgi:hypothetical protein
MVYRSFVIQCASGTVATGRIAGLPRHFCMIKSNIQPIGFHVTAIAIFSRGNMIRRLTSGYGTVVACIASVSSLVMGKRRDQRQPEVCVMARVTLIAGYRMIGGFSDSLCTVMTFDAWLCTDSRMIKGSRCGHKKTGRCVARIARICRWNVRRRLADGENVIVTKLTFRG